MLLLMGVTLFLLATHTSYMNTAVTGPEATTLDHISELLNPEECHELYIRIAIPPKDAKEPLEKKDLFPSSQWQEISSPAQCKETLNRWLEMERGNVDWDRLARALRQIGRPDVSRELKKSLNKNRSLEPKWIVEENHTINADTKQSALLIPATVPIQRRRHRPTPNYRKMYLKEKSWDWKTPFMQLFQAPWYKLRLQECIGPATCIILASFITGLVLWVISVYYVICWKLGRCLFANGVHYDTSPARQNMSFTMIWNNQPGEDSLDEEEEDVGTSEDEEATEDEF